MADQAGRIIGMHGLGLARNLRRRPAPVDRLAPYKVMQPAAGGKLSPPSAALAARPIFRRAKLRAIGSGGRALRTAPPQFPADRGSAAPQQHADHPKARPAPVPAEFRPKDVRPWETFDQNMPNLEVRLGAIYALERIARDSERDHITVMEILCAYIRENAPRNLAQNHDLGEWPKWPGEADAEDQQSRGLRLEGRTKKLKTWCWGLSAPRVDIQAALAVIARRSEEQIAIERRQRRPYDIDDLGYQLDLRKTNLQRSDLRCAHLDRALLQNARFEGTDLYETRLERAKLSRARMDGASLFRGHLEKLF